MRWWKVREQGNKSLVISRPEGISNSMEAGVLAAERSCKEGRRRKRWLGKIRKWRKSRKRANSERNASGNTFLATGNQNAKENLRSSN